MLLLAIDTSTSAITVALRGEGVAASATVLDARGHSEHVAPLIERCLASAGRTPAEVTGVVVGNGPGPFTGLRVGIVTGLVFGHARGVPVHGVCSLDALAADAAPLVGRRELLVATDARRKEVYWARYAVETVDASTPERLVTRRLTEPAVDRPADLPDDVRALPTAGRGPVLFPDLFPHAIGVLDVQAATLAALAEERLDGGEDMPVEPLYLRRPDALTTAERGAR
ncbi:tRNA (adenosine(37)-N6)-threonylcarbamoyltransferase complex dimerization subunit type 1 TsaB [Phycicoccus sp. Root101]|uniref:tRNA (adenosine(37)-N6)-threonylcarbamoyltransferase complex dimerization subunit type 1 TsaB n=1 Tax=Phycicoccus sp. Root101 TaxID=1736421 RepID=UPI0007039E73|nr:tRNA (adenosine(37)-N6)-threonylcarbamoyltransferase complex dimerization subunit type 1 TsaB [Phycicoccus sp. Root101]KQU69175.1 tRNA threonylcarbamoyladenosine biosynthesis protein TsaB [Phycicoccus sp. Root101]